jgi:FkbM family methyltransferase
VKKITFKIICLLRINIFLHMTRYGSSFYLENTDLTYQIFANKAYKSWEYSIYKKYIRDGMTCVDVGANMGLMTVFMAKLAPNGAIFSFEPSQRFYKILNKNLKLNKIHNCTTYNTALGDTESVVHFDEDKSDDTTFKIDPSGKTYVQQLTLDSFFKNQSCIDFMKIDVEGYELEVLRGGTETLSKTKILFIEFISENQSSSGHIGNEMIAMLSENFTLYTLTSTGEEVLFDFDTSKTYQTDLLCKLK